MPGVFTAELMRSLTLEWSASLEGAGDEPSRLRDRDRSHGCNRLLHHGSLPMSLAFLGVLLATYLATLKGAP
jgi:hypothetical protein